jgi:uncharacterized protein YeaC (DUF1315 family)
MYGIEEDHAEFLTKVRIAIESGKTPEGVAKAVHRVCREACKQWGMNPKIETFCRQEYQWAIAASLSHDNRQVLCEPYWSFDLECSIP